MRCVAVCCSVLQCVAVCCSVLQCVAVCCSGPTDARNPVCETGRYREREREREREKRARGGDVGAMWDMRECVYGCSVVW